MRKSDPNQSILDNRLARPSTDSPNLPSLGGQIGNYDSSVVNGKFVFLSYIIKDAFADPKTLNDLFFQAAGTLFQQNQSLKAGENNSVPNANTNDYLIGWCDVANNVGGYGTVYLAGHTGPPDQAYGVAILVDDGQTVSGCPNTAVTWTSSDGTRLRLDADVNHDNPPVLYWRLSIVQ